MAKVDKSYENELTRIKKNVETAYQYFKPNYDRYHDCRDFVFRSSLSEDDKGKLNILNKPTIEFNILEAYISRLRGEFSKQEPSILVSASDGAPVDDKAIEVVQGHMLAILSEANNNSFEYEVYTDLLSGGFSVIKVWTEYANDMSFEQHIRLGRAYDPTLCGFDPLARYSHKGDGRYCFELYPKSKEEFEREFPHIDIAELDFTRAPAGNFSWTYRASDEDVLLICDYYEKKTKKTKIVQLANGKTLPKEDYERYLEQWKEKQHIDQPAIVVKERESDIQVICRYRLIGSKVIEYKETNFKQLPLIFADGNSVLLRENSMGPVQQVTRPYVYHALGTQKLKNFAGQTLANELENLMQTKLKVAKETLPVENDDYLAAYTNVQQASLLVYKSVLGGDFAKPLPPPMEIARPPIPPEIIGTFSVCDQAIQGILGSYDASLGINNNQLSGIAIIEGATQSNAAAMPYVVGFLQALNQGAQIIVDQIPKIHATPRTIPIITKEGKKDYAKVNQRLPNGQPAPDSTRLNYSSNSLDVKVAAGVNFAVQKSRALQQIGVMMGASQSYAEFINTKCLDVLVKNMEVYGGDQLDERAKEFMAEKKQQMQMQMQMQQQQMQMQAAAQQNNPVVQRNQIEMMKTQQKAKQDDVKNQLESGQQSIDMIRAQNDHEKNVLEAIESHQEQAIRMAQMETEKAAKNVDLAIAAAHESHRQYSEERKHTREDVRLHHDISQAKQQAEKNKIAPTQNHTEIN